MGGDRPSQTTRLAVFLAQIHGLRLDIRKNKGGIPLMAPPRLAPQLQSLPPMLYMPVQMTVPGYSKGPRGLFVPMRVSGIFTAATVSPSPTLRQRPSRYTIRAGRNLPDKEFRYLRTVIVTAAVYWGFDSGLRNDKSKLTPPLNLPAPGRCQSLYVALRLSRDMCF